jgi:quercetin dioxygenase-like cupin family protein
MAAGWPTAGATAAGNPLATILSPDRTSIKVVHVTAPVGKPSAIEVKDEPGQKLANTPLMQFLTHKADKVAIFSCPAGLKIPERAPGKGGELLYVVLGSATVHAGTGKHDCGRGTIIIFEEGASHSQIAGPQGFTAIKVRLTE